MFRSMAYVFEVYKEMSFSRAAKNLYISQPSLSAAVKKVEELIGAPIFDRSTNPITLTQIGEAYIYSIRSIMDVEKSFQNYVNDINFMKNGSLTIGGTNFYISFVLPSLLPQFTEQYPNIHVELLEGTTLELKEKLSSGVLDLLLDNSVRTLEEFERKVLRQEHLLLAVPKHFSCNADVADYAFSAADVKENFHLLDSTPSVPMTAFKDQPFLLLREGNSTRTRAMNICRKCNFEPRCKLELSQQITAYNLCCNGMGISFVGDSLIQNVPEVPNLLFYKLEGKDAVRQVSFYYKKNRYMSRAVQVFLNMLNEYTADLR